MRGGRAEGVRRARRGRAEGARSARRAELRGVRRTEREGAGAERARKGRRAVEARSRLSSPTHVVSQCSLSIGLANDRLLREAQISPENSQPAHADWGTFKNTADIFLPALGFIFASQPLPDRAAQAQGMRRYHPGRITFVMLDFKGAFLTRATRSILAQALRALLRIRYSPLLFDGQLGKHPLSDSANNARTCPCP